MRPAKCEAAIDRINIRTYSAPHVVRYYGTLSGWLDAGERSAIAYALASGAAPPLLDMGIGGGRTVTLLQRISADYIGIDYAAEMIHRARERCPDADLRVMDARRLDFSHDSFGLAAFSFNGLDSVGELGRQLVLNEVWRVLRPGGVFVFSSLNHHGVTDRTLVTPLAPDWWRRPRKLARWSIDTLSTFVKRQRYRPLIREGTEESVRPVRAHASGLIGHYTSFARQYEELIRHGFTLEACFDPAGAAADPSGNHAAITHFHYVARKVT